MKQHFPYLDGWRGLAITFLLIGHFFPVPGINLGTVGVALFFVLSGFLMSKILFIDQVPLLTFYQRRIARIVPSVVVLLAVVTLAYYLLGREISRYELLAAATFMNNYFVTRGPWTMPLGHVWSLSVEEHSYILLSLLAFTCRIRKTSGAVELGITAALAALLGLMYWFVFDTNAVQGLWLHSEVAGFGIVISGFLLLAFRGRLPALPAFGVPLLVALGICSYWWQMPPPIAMIFGCGAFALALNFLDRSQGLFRRFLELRALRQMGTWSFSLYLWQQPFYMLSHRDGLPAIVALGCSLVTGIIAFYLIENPARIWLNSVWGPKKATVAGKDDVPMILG